MAAIRLHVDRLLARRAMPRPGDDQRKPSNSMAPPRGVDAIIEKLPNMEPYQLVRIWKNAIKRRADAASSRAWKRAAGRMLESVETEWRKRGFTQPDPNHYFKWPSTDAEGGDKSLSFAGKVEEGMLSYLEYRVGKTNGEASPVRQLILDRVFGAFLPPVFAKEYMEEWGTPNSGRRLEKMAESIAAFARNAKRRDPDLLDQAIRQWEEDLEYLFERYYVGRFHFAWPTTKLEY